MSDRLWYADAMADESSVYEDLSRAVDRGRMIYSAGRVDDELKDLLVLALLPDPTHAEQLFGQDGPLGTFSSRIKMASLIGLLHPDFIRALNHFRKVRNEVAHKTGDLKLDSGPVASHIAALHTALKASQSLGRNYTTPVETRDDRPWFTYLMAAAYFINHFRSVRVHVTKPQNPRFPLV